MTSFESGVISRNDRPYTAAGAPFVDMWVGGEQLPLTGSFLEGFTEELIQDGDGAGNVGGAIIPRAKFVLYDATYSALDRIFLPHALINAYNDKARAHSTILGPGPTGDAYIMHGQKAVDAAQESLRAESFVPEQEIKWQFGWDRDDPDPRARSTLRRGRIMSFSHEFVDRGVRIELELTGRADSDVGVHNRRFNSKGTPRSIGPQTQEESTGTVRPSDIVKFLAVEMGFTSVIVEDTVPVPINSIAQVNKSNLLFILLDLIPLSKSEKTGSSNYRLYTPDNSTFVFSTFTIDVVIKRRYYVGREKSNQVISYRPKLDNIRLLTSAIDDIAVTGFSPLDRSAVFVSTKIDSAGKFQAKLARGGVNSSTINRRVGTTSVAGRVYVTPLRDKETAEILGANIFEKRFQGVFQATATVVGDPSLGTGDYVEFIVLDDTGNMHWTSNRYMIASAKHTVTGGRYDTELEMVGTGSPMLPDDSVANIRIDFSKVYDDSGGRSTSPFNDQRIRSK